MSRIAIIGATSGIAEHCARIWAGRGCDITLVGRDAARLDAVAADLKVRSPASTIDTLVASDFLDPQAVDMIVGTICADRPVDIALIAHGTLPDQGACQNDGALAADTMLVNGVSPALFAEAFAREMVPLDRGTIAIIGSVAGDRGRKANYVYGAAKGLVDRYAQGMQHRLAATNVRVVLAKPGPTATAMTAALQAKGQRMASPADVAKRIVAAIDRGTPVVYAPALWAIIMAVVRLLPRPIFNKLNI